MLTLALKGWLILLIFVSLLVLPLRCWLPAEEALYYCRQSIAAMTWLWIGLVPLVMLGAWAVQRLLGGHHRR